MIRPLVLACACGLTPAAALADMATYEIDREHAVVAFLIDHVGYAKTLGRFTDIEGSFRFDDEAQELADVEVRVGTGSVFTDNDARDNHVRGTDFLNVADFPDMVFTASGGTPETDTAGTVEGTLTLLGQDHPLILDVTLNKMADYPFGHGRETLGVSARGTVTRSDYGMMYAVENGLVGDDVELIIEFEAIRQ